MPGRSPMPSPSCRRSCAGRSGRRRRAATSRRRSGVPGRRMRCPALAPSTPRSLAQPGDLLGQLGLLARAPSTMAAGARDMKDSSASRTRAAASQPSASARSRSSRSRSRSRRGVGRGAGRTVAWISPPARTTVRSPSSRGRLERLGRQLAPERSGAGQPLDRRAERLERRAERGRHVDQRPQPVGRLEARLGAALRMSVTSSMSAPTSASASGRAPLPRASGRR